MTEFEKIFPKPKEIKCMPDEMNKRINRHNLNIWLNQRESWLACLKYIIDKDFIHAMNKEFLIKKIIAEIEELEKEKNHG